MSRAFYTVHRRLKVIAYESQFNLTFFVSQSPYLLNRDALITCSFLSYARLCGEERQGDSTPALTYLGL